MDYKLPISLAMFVKDEEASIRDCIESVKPIISEIVILDTGSTDRTVEICRRYTDKIYRVGFTDFGSIRTVTAHLATQSWIFMIDADERILPEDLHKFVPLICRPNIKKGTNEERDILGQVAIDSWALPRKRWADKWMNNQVEIDAYPDWQVRLFKNYSDKRIGFRRRVHETVFGCVRTAFAADGPTIQHFQGVYKLEQHKVERMDLYQELYNKDIEEGVVHTTPPVVALDKVD
jgi:glycosyltransferase involved in cell wall biosynthesis